MHTRTHTRARIQLPHDPTIFSRYFSWRQPKSQRNIRYAPHPRLRNTQALARIMRTRIYTRTRIQAPLESTIFSRFLLTVQAEYVRIMRTRVYTRTALRTHDKIVGEPTIFSRYFWWPNRAHVDIPTHTQALVRIMRTRVYARTRIQPRFAKTFLSDFF